jgi:hypothetical protein
MKQFVIVGAYGRKYQETAKAGIDWLKGKDFRVKGTSTYCSIRDAESLMRRHDAIVIECDSGISITVKGVLNV